MDAKKAMILVGVALVLFYVVTQPTAATAAVQGLLGWLGAGLVAIADVVSHPFGL